MVELTGGGKLTVGIFPLMGLQSHIMGNAMQSALICVDHRRLFPWRTDCLEELGGDR